PVFNSGNQNYARLVINIFHSTPYPGDPTDYDWYSRVSKQITIAGDYLTDRRNSSAASMIHWHTQDTSGIRNLTEYLTQVQDLIQKAVPCDTVAIFRMDDSGKYMEAATPGTMWKTGVERFYRVD